LLKVSSPAEKFSALLKNAAALNNQGGNQNAGQATGSPMPQMAAAANDASAPPTPLGALQGLPFDDGTLLSGLGLDADGLPLAGLTQAASTQAIGTQALTDVTTQARGATQPHPGTALVAATLGKSVGKGDNQIMTLRLDPPELGRIEVRMEFGKDRSMKATIISEKPEAHLMLQRDAQVLERALQDAGLDGDGSSLEFQLADDGQGFGQDGRHDGSRNQASAGEGAEGDEEIIESTMNWHVDPVTGHMHYNILV